jgi:hypothetical protein
VGGGVGGVGGWGGGGQCLLPGGRLFMGRCCWLTRVVSSIAHLSQWWQRALQSTLCTTYMLDVMSTQWRVCLWIVMQQSWCKTAYIYNARLQLHTCAYPLPLVYSVRP